ncbi:acetate/propionate family kinase [Aliigemmobacter aestuarii]|uniref:Acetate kinase n=1 Tax=Aliigemmobacter aestuarii TaxID=1445661 RepID=A0A4S3MLH7_9RHOB|nr:acetate/propionate family kinase [Gemmobacter aestuarii]THD82937.1 acetate/propionate family kinase [Gemmobacter aestuarii]
MRILVVNAGSSSIKAMVFDEGLSALASVSVAEIGGKATIRAGGAAVPCAAPDHHAAMAAILQALAGQGIAPESLTAAAHRIVHGGAALVAPERVTPDLIARIEACIPIAPLHNPANLAGIRALQAIVPALPQYASFDTAFHATIPPVAHRYALPAAEEARGLRRYGFHGLSYASLVAHLPMLAEAPLPRRLLAFHLGNGASATAILDGRSVASTMGYSPLAGLVMGTRTGDIDGNAVLKMAEDHGIDGAARILNRESGLKALGGQSDMRALKAAGTAEAAFAIDHFCYWAARHGASLMAAMAGLDAIAFTGGIGENDADARRAIIGHLAFTGAELDPEANALGASAIHSATSSVAVWIVPAQEERQIAQEALGLIRKGPGRAEGDA